MRHVGKHLASQTIRHAQRLVPGRQVGRHVIERRRDARNLVTAALGGASGQVAGPEPFGRTFERLQPPARRLEDEDGRDHRDDNQHRGPGQRQQAADVTSHRGGRRRRREDDHTAQLVADLNGRHDHGRSPQRGLGGHSLAVAASQQTAHDPPQILGQRSGPVGDDTSVLHHHVNRLNAAVFPIEISRQIDVGILSEGRSDIGRDDGGDVVRRTARPRIPGSGQQITEHRVLRQQDRDNEDHEAESDPEIETAEHRAPIIAHGRAPGRLVALFSTRRHTSATRWFVLFRRRAPAVMDVYQPRHTSVTLSRSTEA